MAEIVKVFDEIASLVWDLIAIGFGIVLLQIMWKVTIEIASESKK